MSAGASAVERLRFQVFLIWFGGLIATALAILAAPALRPGVFFHDQAADLFLVAAPSWIPTVACFGAIWFNSRAEQRAARGSPSTPREVPTNPARAARLITMLSVALLVWFEFAALYLSEFPAVEEALEIPQGRSIEERLAAVVKVATLLSPMSLAPVIWLTRGGAHDDSRPQKADAGAA
ncbi:MAG TPA: hypothetical protein VEI02_09890 [Planctomycetota bacterium]|nr:hypothetical protein [Planctomycetota bacterium]